MVSFMAKFLRYNIFMLTEPLMESFIIKQIKLASFFLDVHHKLLQWSNLCVDGSFDVINGFNVLADYVRNCITMQFKPTSQIRNPFNSLEYSSAMINIYFYEKFRIIVFIIIIIIKLWLKVSQ